MANTATRLITLIMLLQRRPNQKAADLAQELGVSVRTIHRYVGMLDEMGIPVYSERGPYGGFSLVRGFKMPPMVFTPDEAVAVYLGCTLVGEMWGEMYREAAQGALAKLDNVLPDEQRHEVAWARRTLLATGMHRADHESLAAHLEKLRRAIRERRQVAMIYRGRGQAESHRREVEPYALVHRWGWWYGIGFCHLRGAMRSFRVDRILEMDLLDQTFDVPEGFDINAYLAQESQARPQVRARLRFSPQHAYLALDDRAFWEAVEERPNGSVEVILTAPDLEFAARIASNYAPHAVVVEPDELRGLVRERARAVVALYESIEHGEQDD